MLSALIGVALTTFFIGAVVYYAILAWKEIINWFQHWIHRHQNVDKDAVGFTVREAMKNGNYNVVQGIFNKDDNSIEDARRIEAGDLDSTTRAQICGREKVTIFE